MSTARKEFEEIARANGATDFSLKPDGRYAVQNLQSRWVYFKLGWDRSSAPDLLEALTYAASAQSLRGHREAQRIARAAIARATGGAA